MKKFLLLLGACYAASIGVATAQVSEKKYGPGVTDTEIKIGQTMPYSGPASAYGIVGLVEQAYFKSLNAKGGINGRKINLISLDDAYSPPKTVEQTRKLVESDEVLLIYGSVGTLTNTAVHKYLNGKKVPQVLISTGGSKWNDLKNYPWTTAFYPPYEMEARIYAKYVLENKPDAKIAIFSQNDDMGRDYVKGFRAGLGSKANSMIVAEATYETTEPTVDSQIVKLKASGADLLFNVSTPKFGAQAIKRVHELDWKPLTFLASVASSIDGTLRPAGIEASQGLITAQYSKAPSDPLWKDDQAMKDYYAFMKDNGLEGRSTDNNAVGGYVSASLMHKVLEAAGDNLTRENIMSKVKGINEKTLPMLLPGIAVKTTDDDVSGFHGLHLLKFQGESWALFGNVITE